MRYSILVLMKTKASIHSSVLFWNDLKIATNRLAISWLRHAIPLKAGISITFINRLSSSLVSL